MADEGVGKFGRYTENFYECPMITKKEFPLCFLVPGHGFWDNAYHW